MINSVLKALDSLPVGNTAASGVLPADTNVATNSPDFSALLSSLNEDEALGIIELDAELSLSANGKTMPELLAALEPGGKALPLGAYTVLSASAIPVEAVTTPEIQLDGEVHAGYPSGATPHELVSPTKVRSDSSSPPSQAAHPSTPEEIARLLATLNATKGAAKTTAGENTLAQQPGSALRVSEVPSNHTQSLGKTIEAMAQPLTSSSDVESPATEQPAAHRAKLNGMLADSTAVMRVEPMAGSGPNASTDIQLSQAGPAGASSSHGITIGPAGDMNSSPQPQLEALIETLTSARENGKAARGDLTLRHAEFGNVALRLDHSDGELTAKLSSRDPAFAASAQAALNERAAIAASSETSSGAQRGHDQSGMAGQSRDGTMMGSGAERGADQNGRDASSEPNDFADGRLQSAEMEATSPSPSDRSNSERGHFA